MLAGADPGVGGREDPRLEFDPLNSAPCELSRDPAVRLMLAGAITGNVPTASPPELDDNVIGVDCVASLVDDIRLANTAAITYILPNNHCCVIGIGKRYYSLLL